MRRLAQMLLFLIAIAGPVSCGAIYDVEKLGAVPPDASVPDAGPEEAAPPRFCELATPKPTHCFDFDGTDPLEGWDNTLINPDPFVHGGGSFPGVAASRDGSNAWAAELTATKAAASAALAKNIVAMKDTTYVAFDALVEGTDPPTPDERVVIANLVIGATPETYVGQVSLAYDKKGGLYGGVSPTDSAPSEGEFLRSPVGRGWMRIELVLDRSAAARDAGGGGGGQLEVFVEGSQLVRTGIPKVLGTRDDLLLMLGPIRGFEGRDARVLLDNVIVEAR